MKKVILFLIILGALNTVQASVYPEKLNNGDNFNDFADFHGIYNKIYQDVHSEDLIEVCKRTLRWPEFWKKKGENDELIYSISNCENFREKSEFSESFLNKETPNIKDFNIFRDDFQKRFNTERHLLRMENNSKRRTGLSGIFTDGTEDQRTSRFDIVFSLNNVDETFFGEKSERPVYEYTKNKLELNETSEDDWLDQVEENLPSPEVSFSEMKSLSGALWKSSKIFREKLNPFPLWLTHTGKHMGDAVDANGVLGDSMFTAETHGVPSFPVSKAEADVLRYNDVLNKLRAFDAQFQFRQSAFATEAEEESQRRNQLGVVFNEKRLQKKEIKNSLKLFEAGQFRNYEEAIFESSAPFFKYFQEYVKFFRDGAILINEEIFPPFFQKTIFPF